MRRALPMHEAIVAMRGAFLELSRGIVEMPLRTRLAMEDASTLVMPCYLKEGGLGLKVVSIFPKNAERGLAIIQGLIVLLDSETGEPKALLEGSELTAIRTGAVGGLATDLFARKEAKKAAFIGLGVQAKKQLEAVMCVRKIEEVFLYSRDEKKAQDFKRAIEKMPFSPKKITLAKSAEDAASQAEIITLSTTSSTPILGPKDIPKGCHVNLIGSFTASMQEIDPLCLKGHRVIVDQKIASMNESGEIRGALEKGYLKESDLEEIGEVIHQKKGRQDNDEITFFKSVGLAAQDIAAAEVAFQNAMKNKMGTMVSL